MLKPTHCFMPAGASLRKKLRSQISLMLKTNLREDMRLTLWKTTHENTVLCIFTSCSSINGNASAKSCMQSSKDKASASGFEGSVA